MNTASNGYSYADASLNPSHAYLLPAVLALLRQCGVKRLFEIGSGNGSTADVLSRAGIEVQGIEPSAEGVAQANTVYPHLAIRQGSAYDALAGTFGRSPCVLSLEVVEHLQDPRAFARSAYEVLEPGGVFVLSTPFHGYWKNLALALTGRMDAHFTALWDGGHIKFWSERTIRELLVEVGFEVVEIVRVGRLRPLAKSMIVVARRRGP